MSGRSQNADGLWRWLVGGLVAGAAMLGLAIAAYEFGYAKGAIISRRSFIRASGRRRPRPIRHRCPPRAPP